MNKVNLKESSVPVREIRLGSITGFEGTAGELVKCSRSGKLRDSVRSFSQCMGCSSLNAFCQLSMITDAAIINAIENFNMIKKSAGLSQTNYLCNYQFAFQMHM